MVVSAAAIQTVVRRPAWAANASYRRRAVRVTKATTARPADMHSTDSHAELWSNNCHQLRKMYVSVTTVETAALRCQRSGVSIEVSSNNPRSAKSTASETPGGGGSAAGGTSSGT